MTGEPPVTPSGRDTRPRKGQVWRRHRDNSPVRVFYRRMGWVFAYDGENGQHRGRGMSEEAFVANHNFERQR